MATKLTLEYNASCPASHYCLLVVLYADLADRVTLKPMQKLIFKKGRGWQPPKLFASKKKLKLDPQQISLYLLNDSSPTEPLYPFKAKQHIDLWLEVVEQYITIPIITAASTDDEKTYRQQYTKIFDKLEEINHHLSHHPYLCGESPSLADLALFAQLIRFDIIYYFLFLLNWKRMLDYPCIWAFIRRIYQSDGVADTIQFGQIKRDYFSLKAFNPSLVIPRGPADDFTLPLSMPII